MTHIVVAQHDSFWVPSGSRCIDEAAALVGSETADRSDQRLLGHVLPQLHELCPLQKHTHVQLLLLNPDLTELNTDS